MWQLLTSKLPPPDQCRRCGGLEPSVLEAHSGGICAQCWHTIDWPEEQRKP